GETATDTFTYTVSDGTAEPITKTVTVTINGANDAPIVSDIATSTSEDNSVLIEPEFSDADSSDTHTITFDASTTTGEVSLVESKFRYDPNGQFEHLAVGETATDTFTYTVDDGNGGIVTKIVTVSIDGANDTPMFVTTTVNVSEPVEIFASDGQLSDRFGSSLATNPSGQILVGAYGDEDHGTWTGSVYIYTPEEDFYSEIKLTAFDGEIYDHFGTAVAVNSDGVLVVGSPSDDDQGSASGSVYVFQPKENGSYKVEKLTDDHGSRVDAFGASVAISETGTIVVGSTFGDGSIRNSGTVYVYEMDSSGKYIAKELYASDGVQGAHFGSAVSINSQGDIVVSAISNSGSADRSGGIYVYAKNGDGTYSETKLSSFDVLKPGPFGEQVAINNMGVVAVGSSLEHSSGDSTGYVTIYSPNGHGGYSEHKIIASDGNSGDYFGSSIAINNDGVIVVAARQTAVQDEEQGRVYVYVPQLSGGYTEYKLFGPMGASQKFLVDAVSIDDEGTVSVGAPYDGNGKVYIYQPDSSGAYSTQSTNNNLIETFDTSPITQSLQLAFTDVDVSDDAHTASITDVSATGVTSGLSSLNDDDLKALLSVT
ncbi:VCBS domain-containing protein, partial [Pseudovibrio sp. POLY-S9]|uniref:VCBS domain-containing protein n=1 Tax=Pseudovibrio sp. POLY-S9 TaxID=1576596 RepID=UPI0007092A69